LLHSATRTITYDALGRRQSLASGGVAVARLHDGVDPVQQQAGGSVQANLLTGLGIDERFARTGGPTTSTLLTDMLGSTVALADSTGAITTYYGYDAYGTTTSSGAANDNPINSRGARTMAPARTIIGHGTIARPGVDLFPKTLLVQAQSISMLTLKIILCRSRIRPAYRLFHWSSSPDPVF
jgi:hypothetical protein